MVVDDETPRLVLWLLLLFEQPRVGHLVVVRGWVVAIDIAFFSLFW
jgi:hypothetical protein